VFDRFRKPKPTSDIPVVVNRKGTTLRLDHCRAEHLEAGARYSRRQASRAETAATKKGGGELRFQRAHRYYEIARFLDALAVELGPEKRVCDLRRTRLREVLASAERLRRET